MPELPARLAELLKKTQSLLGSTKSIFDGGTVFTIEEMIRSALSLEEDRERRVQLSFLLTEFRDFYHSMVHPKPAADAQVLIDEAPASAAITLIPPHPGGKNAGLQEIRRAVQAAGIAYGLNFSALDAAAEKFSRKDELVFSLAIAQGEEATKGEDGSVEFLCGVFDKGRLFSTEAPGNPEMLAGLETVEAGRTVARIRPPGEGQPGRGVRGQELRPFRGAEAAVRLGDGLRRAPGGTEIQAAHAGVVVRDGESLDVVPFYVISGDLRPGQDTSFNGNVLVTGNMLGPVTVRAEDVYVAGSVEAATLAAMGDIWIGGGFAGKKTGTAETDGRFYARSIADATVTALGDVVARNSITYSEVTSNARVVVVEERGTIVGGAIAALREIVARTIGSDFGTETATTVGCDFLTPRRLEKIDRRIREHEQNLAKIDLLKRKLAEARVDVTKLPPDKQDLYIAVLQKELKAREELASLRRGKEKFAASMREFLKASIKVLEMLHPPVKVRIGQAVREIQERLEKVTLVLDQDRQISARKEP